MWSVIEAALLPRLIGCGKTAKWVLTEATLSAAEAMQCGLVECVVPRADLDHAVARWTQAILHAGPTAVLLQKALSILWGRLSMDNFFIPHYVTLCDNGEKCIEAVSAGGLRSATLCPTPHPHTCQPTVTAGIRRVGTVLLLCCSHHQKWTNVGSQSQRPSTMAIDFIWVWLAGEGERWDLNPRPLEPQVSVLGP